MESDGVTKHCQSNKCFMTTWDSRLIMQSENISIFKTKVSWRESNSKPELTVNRPRDSLSQLKPFLFSSSFFFKENGLNITELCSKASFQFLLPESRCRACEWGQPICQVFQLRAFNATMFPARNVFSEMYKYMVNTLIYLNVLKHNHQAWLALCALHEISLLLIPQTSPHSSQHRRALIG